MKHPISEKQLAANRANARKSSGPKSTAGKHACSKNAIKHGFLAQTILLPGESPTRFLQLKNTYLRKFQPQTQDEFDLVDTLTVNRWRLLRIWTFESVSLIHEQRRQAPANARENPPTQAMLAQRAVDTPPRTQEALSRHEVRLDRQYYKALDRLTKIKAEREAEEKSSKQTHPNEANKTLNLIEYPMKNPMESHGQPMETHENPIENPSENPRAA